MAHKESDVSVAPTSAASTDFLRSAVLFGHSALFAVLGLTAATYDQVEVGWRERTDALLAEIQLLGSRCCVRHGGSGLLHG